MSDEAQGKGLEGAQRPQARRMLSVQDIAAMYDIRVEAVRQWKLTPAVTVPFGKGRKLRLYWEDEVIAYATSRRRLNRLPKPKEQEPQKP